MEMGGGFPNVGAIWTEENGDVPFDENPLAARMGAHFFHLSKAVVLQKGVKIDFFLVCFWICRPVLPVFPFKLLFKCFEMRIRCEPGVFADKGLIGGGF